MEKKAAHRIRLRVDSSTLEELQERAERSRLGLATELKRALERGLDDGFTENSDLTRLEVIALATLIGTEHLLRFLERTYPEGEERSLRLREGAAEAAERRLEEVRTRLAREAEA
jgi:hypothetical protein